MTELPPIGRRGFRTPDEVRADLAAIAGAEPPLNEARVKSEYYKAPRGAFSVEDDGENITLLVDGRPVRTFAAAKLRGGWLSLFDPERYDKAGYLLDFEIGTIDPIQMTGPGADPVPRASMEQQADRAPEGE